LRGLLFQRGSAAVPELATDIVLFRLVEVEGRAERHVGRRRRVAVAEQPRAHTLGGGRAAVRIGQAGAHRVTGRASLPRRVGQVHILEKQLAKAQLCGQLLTGLQGGRLFGLADPHRGCRRHRQPQQGPPHLPACTRACAPKIHAFTSSTHPRGPFFLHRLPDARIERDHGQLFDTSPGAAARAGRPDRFANTFHAYDIHGTAQAGTAG
jgi:hypothetical protein